MRYQFVDILLLLSQRRRAYNAISRDSALEHFERYRQ